MSMKQSGFTLAELVITLSIIGMAAVLFAPKLVNIVPDKYKVKVLQYVALMENTTTAIMSDDTLFKQEYKYNAEQDETSPTCYGLECVNNFETVFKEKLGIKNDLTGPENTKWTISLSSNGDYEITIDMDGSKTGCVYSSSCKPKDVDTFKFILNKHGSVVPNDALTAAYIKNPFNINDRKADLDSAKLLLDKYSVKDTGNEDTTNEDTGNE